MEANICVFVWKQNVFLHFCIYKRSTLEANICIFVWKQNVFLHFCIYSIVPQIIFFSVWKSKTNFLLLTILCPQLSCIYLPSLRLYIHIVDYGQRKTSSDFRGILSCQQECAKTKPNTSYTWEWYHLITNNIRT